MLTRETYPVSRSWYLLWFTYIAFSIIGSEKSCRIRKKCLIIIRCFTAATEKFENTKTLILVIAKITSWMAGQRRHFLAWYLIGSYARALIHYNLVTSQRITSRNHSKQPERMFFFWLAENDFTNDVHLLGSLTWDSTKYLPRLYLDQFNRVSSGHEWQSSNSLMIVIDERKFSFLNHVLGYLR